ncbi:cytochrome P450 71BT1-like [Andrographis paniculata]|uniref:cytochrome P450 71BT1-like n=1 Tax=Andrographis paniculata TaxID=175694 RepID=UPI0021E87D77|nr:cytochrome P450 71BT1-like [Andrographis paniculata]
MDDTFVYVAGLALAITIPILCGWYLKLNSHSSSRLPPGPRGLPILGYIPFLGPDLLGKVSALAHRHGPIYKMWLGQKLCVVISSPTLVRQIARDHDVVFSNRDTTAAAKALSHGGDGFAHAPYTQEWRVLRKIFVRDMQSNKGMQASARLRTEECRKAVRYVYARKGEPVDVGDLAFTTELSLTMNILRSVRC